jgi:hypothetical protein
VSDIDDRCLKDYQTARLREKASPKSVNKEIGFLLRLLGEQRDEIRGRLRRQKTLKLRVTKQVGKASLRSCAPIGRPLC